MTDRSAALTRGSLKTPRAAAVAGILFALLYGTSLVIVRLSIPADPSGDTAWLERNFRSVSLALNLVPYAGIAFLWFIGVIRDRVGAMEDRLFATVFLGSGLLFLALTFVGWRWPADPWPATRWIRTRCWGAASTRTAGRSGTT